MKPKLILFTLLLAAAAQAQQAAPSPDALPPGPLLNKAPDFAQWTITAKSSGAAVPTAEGEDQGAAKKEKEKERPQGDLRIGTIQTGKVRHQVRVKGSQVIGDLWTVEGATVSIDPHSKMPQVAGGGGGTAEADFPGLEWISANNFAGIQGVGGRKAIVFKGRADYLIDAESTLPEQVDATAYIDLETRLPIAMKRGDVYTFEFGPKPQTMLTPPPAVSQALVDARQRALRSAARPAPEPP